MNNKKLNKVGFILKYHKMAHDPVAVKILFDAYSYNQLQGIIFTKTYQKEKWIRPVQVISFLVSNSIYNKTRGNKITALIFSMLFFGYSWYFKVFLTKRK